jgi:8-oxo-dGTP pyrophosphatase MutT (NUDIX family)
METTDDDSCPAPSLLPIPMQHPAIARLARALRERPAVSLHVEESVRRAAVALILRAGAPDELDVLLIKRATYVGDPWSGHVALPGGRREPGDETLEQTAIRETREETAIDLSREGTILGRLDDVRPHTIVQPALVITPYVAAVAGDIRVQPGPEVAEAFWVPVAALQDPQASREIVLELTGGPRAVWSFHHGGHIIWGLTERILRNFFQYLP